MRIATSLFAVACLATIAVAAPVGAETLPSGVIIEKVKVNASGERPTAADVVKVHYRGTLDDGTEFDSSYKRGAPATFPLGNVIPCWTLGVQQLRVGEKANLTCPSQTAYGPRGIPGRIAPDSTLHFEVELISIEK